LITQSPLPLRIGADAPAPAIEVQEAAVAEGIPVEGVRMMVEDGTLKAAPSDDELHPATVPEAGPTAALSSTDQPGAELLPGADHETATGDHDSSRMPA
jgi:hypothetical protein